MTLLELYNFLEHEIKEDILTINFITAEGVYTFLLYTLKINSLKIHSCKLELISDQLVLNGQVDIPPYTSIGIGKIKILSSIIENKDSSDFSNSYVDYKVTISIDGSGSLADFAGKIAPSIDEQGKISKSLFAEFIITQPVLEFCLQDKSVISVTGFASCSNLDSKWNLYKVLLSNTTTFIGTVNLYGEQYPIWDILFLINKPFSFPLGNVTANILMKTGIHSTSWEELYVIKAYLVFRVYIESISQEILFQSELFKENKSFGISENLWSCAAFFNPSFSIGNIVNFMGSLFHVSKGSLLLPKNTFLSSFGLKELQMKLALKGKSIFDGMEMKYIVGDFSLAQPIETPIPKLTLENFEMVWEISWWEGKEKPLVTLFALAEASLKIGNYQINGELKAYFPAMNFQGTLTLQKNLSMTELAQNCNVNIPEKWKGNKNEIASFNIDASVPKRSLYISASVSNILEIPIGNLKLCIESIKVNVGFYQGGLDFSFKGVLAFKPQNSNSFAFTIEASYINKGWYFSGELSYGRVNIGALLMSLIKVQVPENMGGVFLDKFSISYSSIENQFSVSAVFYAELFEIFGTRPKIGGRILFKQTEKKKFIAVAFYMQIGIFKLLVQANDFYSKENRTFLFRLELRNNYLQGVYQKAEQGDELITITMGGMTFGDIVLELIHLINPNAKNSLSSPWDILNSIKLSNFSLTINVTKKTASLIYHVNRNIAGLMQLDDIGLAYGGQSIKFILTGKCLNETYTTDNPLSWDAIHGSPTENLATNEQKFKLYYLGIGNHLDLAINNTTIEKILEEVKEQLIPTSDKSQVPTVEYSEKNGWLIGADFEINDLLRCRILLYSPKLYGALIEVNVTKQSPLFFLNGLLLELYYKKISDSTGMFHCRVVFPKKFANFTLGALSIHLGQVILEIYTNGSFYIDLGFPHNRDFSNSFGLSFGIYSGKGGLYFGTFTGDAVNSVPEIINGVFSPVIKIGVGLMVGLSRSFDLGVVKGGVSLMVVGIFEGTFAMFNPKDSNQKGALYYKATAIVGITGSLFLSVDFKIIAIGASAEISAFCEITLESYKHSKLAVELKLTLSAYIKILFFKISFSFHFEQKVEFYFGSDSTTPWILANTRLKKVSYRSRKQSFLFNQVSLSNQASNNFGNYTITPLITLLCSVSNISPQKEFCYCIAFPVILYPQDLKSLLKLILQWLISCTYKDVITQDDRILEKDIINQIEYSDVIELLKNNTKFIPKLQINSEDDNQEQSEGIVFPMLPQITLHIDNDDINYNENLVDNTYMRKISEHFEKLNADPTYKIPESATGDKIPLCAAVLTDWFRMATSEIISRISYLFETITIPYTNFDTIPSYGIDIKEVLQKNPELLVNLIKIPKYTITVSHKDTLEKIKTNYNIKDYNHLWNSVCETTMLVIENPTICVDNYCFDNKDVNMNTLEVASFFFVRFFNPDITYVAYAEKLLINNKSISMSWEQKDSITLNLKLSSDKTRPSLYGDTVIRLAKALAIQNGDYIGEDWLNFSRKFKELNNCDETEIKNSYTLFGTYVISNVPTIGFLYRTCFPNINKKPEDYNAIWNSENLRPLASISILEQSTEYDNNSQDNILKDKKVSDIIEKYGIEEIKNMFLQGNIKVAERQTIETIIIPHSKQIPCEEIINQILTDSNISEIGSILSRAFLQGTRVPDPKTEKQTPLYSLLKQQIELPKIMKEYQLSISCNDTNCEWLEPSTEQVTLTSEWLSELLPKGTLNQSILPTLASPFAKHEKSWSLTNDYNILNSSSIQTLTMLPKDCINYINSYSLPRIECDGEKILNPQWSIIIPIRIVQKSSRAYYICGAYADDRSLLYSLMTYSSYISECNFMYHPSTLESEKDGLAKENFTHCTIIKTKLSTETHMAFRSRTFSTNFRNEYFYDMKDTNDNENIKNFLRLLWQCSVIGGGYWLSCEGDKFPDSIFDSEKSGTVFLVSTFSNISDSLEKTKKYDLPINSVCFSHKAEKVVLYGDKETVYTPVLPAGCIGFTLDRLFEEDNKLENLFQILGYRITSEREKKEYESAPILPQNDQQNSLHYNIAIPLWKLYGDGISPYSAIGKKVNIDFYLCDVLGNILPLDDICQVVGEYNDFLIALHELPDTRLTYRFVKQDSKICIEIICSYCEKENSIEEGQKELSEEEEKLMKANHVKNAYYQLNCDDIVAFVETTLEETKYLLDQKILEQLREYVKALYKKLTVSEESNIEPVKIIVDIKLDKLPETIVPLNVFITLKRIIKNKTEMEYMPDDIKHNHIKYAQTKLLLDKNFLLDFQNAFSDFKDYICKIAMNQSDEPYFIPLGKLIENMKIQPYSYELDLESHVKIKSPEFFAMAPLSNNLITKSIKEPKDKMFVNIDINTWEKRFLADIEYLLSNEVVCDAAKLCGETLKEMIEAKKTIANAIAKRLLPIRQNSADCDYNSIQHYIIDQFLIDLNFVYDIDVIAVYQSEFKLKVHEQIRLEPQPQSPNISSAMKIAPNRKAFCLSLLDTNYDNSNKLELDVVFPNIEYNIKNLEQNYEKSEWLRFAEPISSKDFSISFNSETQIPYPKKECPMPPIIANQSFCNHQEKFLRWNWSATICCDAYEQFTVYVALRFTTKLQLRSGKRKGVFDILAEYDYEREELFAKLENQETFIESYKKIAASVSAYASSLQPSNLKFTNFNQEQTSNNITIEINFELGNIVNYTILPNANRDKILNQLGAKLEPIQRISGSKKGEPLMFSVQISNLPIYTCHEVTPYAWIIQNNNLFNDMKQPIREEFIFKTEKVSLPSIKASVDYQEPIMIYGSSIKEIVASFWSKLEFEHNNQNMQLSLTIFYKYPVSNIDLGLDVTIPITFIPDVYNYNIIENNIINWLKDIRSYNNNNLEGKLCFDILIYKKYSDFLLLHATFVTPLNIREIQQ